MAKDVIIALDFPSGKIALDFLKKFEGESVYVKIGMELFYKEGPSIVREIKKLGHKIFLDLKIHDIPNTCKGATNSLISLDVDMINFHSAGGKKMLSEASEIVSREKPEMITLGVTMLTSTDEETMYDELQIKINHWKMLFFLMQNLHKMQIYQELYVLHLKCQR